MSERSADSCTCHECQAACQRKPGWFLPGEAERAAQLMDMTMEDFFSRYLAVDWLEDYPDDIFVLSPVVVGEDPGEEFPGDPRGTCVFYVEGRCQIHEAKPYECRAYWCGMKRGDALSHEEVGRRWAGEPQEQIRTLLGREPYSVEFQGGGILGLLGGW